METDDIDDTDDRAARRYVVALMQAQAEQRRALERWRRRGKECPIQRVRLYD